DSNQEMLGRMEERIWGEIEEFVKRRGKLYLGKKSIIKSGSYIEGPVCIGDNTIIGPNAYLRSFTSIGDDCKIGNGVEVKNSIIMDRTNVPHLSYIGDSIIGKNCNIGAGTLVGNLRLDEKNVKMRIRSELKDTGRRKFGCLIGDNVKIGLNVMINAGRKIGSNSLIGPGVIVYKDIPPNSFILQKQALKK
ncbi:MAG: glucose-1-phosphate thymidylyltransferase, partial [Euryarchaeota archaeon]|nr:glucose-1-phosphate thymidylyltransferase [Euryarchaeota archaeon]